MRWALCLLWLALAVPARAEAAPEPARKLSADARTAPAAPSPGWLGSSLVVLAGASLGWALWRRHRLARAAGGPALEVVAQVALGGKARALWLRAAERELLLAVGPSSVQVLDSWTEAPPAPLAEPPRANHRSRRARAAWCRRAPLAEPAAPRLRTRRMR